MDPRRGWIEALHALRKVRNDFAHSTADIALSAPAHDHHPGGFPRGHGPPAETPAADPGYRVFRNHIRWRQPRRQQGSLKALLENLLETVLSGGSNLRIANKRELARFGPPIELEIAAAIVEYSKLIGALVFPVAGDLELSHQGFELSEGSVEMHPNLNPVLTVLCWR
jgi:hypothetical protein